MLHTIWAKQRLRTLQKEIDAESKLNVESVGLIMAVQEREWIEENFGVAAKQTGLPLSLQTSEAVDSLQNAPASPGPASPRSPGGSRLQQKLQGLRLGTSDRELTTSRKESRAADGGAGFWGEQNPLSPETGDVAVSSFAAIKGNRETPFDSLASLAAKPSQKPSTAAAAAAPAPAPPPARRIAAAQPPASLLKEQQSMGMGSLNSFGGFQSMAPPTPESSQAAPGHGGGKEDDEDLFALPISPRSPEMSKSPFSFAREDTQRYVQGVGGKAS
ncbi:MAG: hypothetical protein INR71_05645 [Terriglobus roseus]|nr:hypothetical protein [Terriglobus roseus]